jgi:hypothetical protein
MTDNPTAQATIAPVPERKPLTPAAQRALAEAEARRAAIDAEAARIRAVKEKDGREGPEPVRYGDWEVKGLASDF